jgi:signal transduction histidine kinase
MKSRIHQTQRTGRRRHDKLLIAATRAASVLLKSSSCDESIPCALKFLGESVQSDCAFVFEADDSRNNERASLRYAWQALGAYENSSVMPIPADLVCPPEFVGLYNGKVVTATRGFAASPAMKAFLERIGRNSFLFAPIAIDGIHWGCFGFAGNDTENEWLPEEIDAIHMFGDLIGASIMRQRYIKDLIHAYEMAKIKSDEAANANAEKNRFLANMSHELRSPLNAILGFSDLMQRESLGPLGSARYKEYAADIHDSGTHQLNLINDLLDIAKIESGRMEIKPRLIDAHGLVGDIVRMFEVKSQERGQILSTKIDGRVTTIYGDERATKQILINLLSNALKFAPEAGHISISVRRDEREDIELSVEDNGPGVPKEKLDLLFKPFSQADNHYGAQGKGTGLGLALVRGLAGLHGGRAWIESEEGNGTRICVVLPAPPADLAPEALQEIRIA